MIRVLWVGEIEVDGIMVLSRMVALRGKCDQSLGMKRIEGGKAVRGGGGQAS
jgi:hypothetical protein